jgi:4-oxalocrotonate tautomerase
MPYLRVSISENKSQNVSNQVAQLLTGLAVEVLGKQESAVSVDINYTKNENWFVGGKQVESDTATFFIEIKVTEGTNTRDEKAQFVQDAFTGMEKILGKIDPTSYIVLHDVNSDSWGYGGKTQEYRYIKG